MLGQNLSHSVRSFCDMRPFFRDCKYLYPPYFKCLQSVLFDTWDVPDSNCKPLDVKLPTTFLSLGIVRFKLRSSCAENLRGRPLLSLRWSNTGSPLIGFFAWTYFCAFEYCRNICKRFLPLTLEIWYSALIWQEFSTDILGIFCCVCLPDHLILRYIHLKKIVEIINFITAGALALEKVCLNYEIQLAWDIFTRKKLFAAWNSTSVGHVHLIKVCLHYQFLH